SVPESTSRSKGESSNSESSKTAKGTITASALRVRSGPGTNYSTLTTYKRNTTVNILGKGQGSGGLWYKISYQGGKEAWVSAQYVKASGTIPNVDGPSSKKTDAKDESNLPVGTVTGSVVNIRSVPSTSNNKPIATVNKGQQLKIVGEKNGWFQVILPNGTK